MKKKKVIAKVKKVVVKNAKPSSKKIAVKKAVVKNLPVAKKKFSMTLEMADETFKSKGDSIIECLDQIKPAMLKSKGILSVFSGSLKSVRVMYPFEIKRLLSGSVSKVVYQNRTLATLK